MIIVCMSVTLHEYIGLYAQSSAGAILSVLLSVRFTLNDPFKI